MQFLFLVALVTHVDDRQVQYLADSENDTHSVFTPHWREAKLFDNYAEAVAYAHYLHESVAGVSAEVRWMLRNLGEKVAVNRSPEYLAR